MKKFELCFSWRNVDWIVHIDDYDYSPYEPATGPTYSCGGTPPWPADVTINAGHLVIDGADTEVAKSVNRQLLESPRLFDQLMREYGEGFEAELLETIESYEEDYHE